MLQEAGCSRIIGVDTNGAKEKRAREKAATKTLAEKLKEAQKRTRELTAQKAMAAINAVRKSSRHRRRSSRYGD